jgi:hypothetical protein
VVNVIGAEHLGVLCQTDPAEPTIDVQVPSPRGSCQRQFLKKG